MDPNIPVLSLTLNLYRNHILCHLLNRIFFHFVFFPFGGMEIGGRGNLTIKHFWNADLKQDLFLKI